MTEDINIRNSDWDLFYPYYLISSNIILKVVDSFDLKLSVSVNQVPTQYTDNPNNTNLVINLMFLWPESDEIDNYLILLKSRSLSNHAPLTIDISISKEFIQDK